MIASKLLRNSIRMQIVFAFLTLTVMIIALEILAYSWIKQMLIINSLKEDSAKLKESQMQVKSASSEFILKERTNERFFSTGRSLYLDRYDRHLRELRKTIREIESQQVLRISDGWEMKNLGSSIESYDRIFRQMVDRIKIRGHGKYGLIGEFDKSIKSLLKYDFGKDNLAVMNLQLFVKDYLLTGDENLTNNISNEIFNFTMALESHIKDEEVEKVSGILINYEDIFIQLTKVDGELGIYTSGGLQKSLFDAIDELDRAILLKKFNSRIYSAYEENVFKLFLSFFLVVGVSVITAVIIHNRLLKTLVKPIQEMKSIIAKMGRGEVPNKAVEFKVEDLNDMAIALNNLVTGTRNYQEFANNIGRGNLDSEFTPLSNDDILGKSLLSMRESLKSNAQESARRTWASHGLSELNNILRNCVGNEEALFNMTLQFIVKYSNCNQGSLFLLNDDNEGNRYLELVACYAWGKRKYLDKRVEFEKGLLGQCVLEQDVIHVTDLPNDYIKITSGLGQANPNSLMIVPLKLENHVMGVIEVASFNCFEGYQIELLKKFAGLVAATIKSEGLNTKTRALLNVAHDSPKLSGKQITNSETSMRVIGNMVLN